jgi:hypothetical protein
VKSLKTLTFVLPVSLGLGLLLSLLGGGVWWIGWLAYSLLLILILLALTSLWHASGSQRGLLVILLLAFFLRLGSGVFFSWVLPIQGNDSDTHNAGYIFRDASTYDRQAWELASSGDSLWKTFDRSYGIEEQYGGLTLLVSTLYRLLSPDMQRPWLIILVTAWAGAAACGYAWRAGRRAWGDKAGWIVGWILALYPEAILAGASPIREPFVILFLTAGFSALTTWLDAHRKGGLIGMAACFLGLLFFSPGFAVLSLFFLMIWVLLIQKNIRIHWGWLLAGAGLGLLSILLLGWLVSGTLRAPAGPVANLVDWLRYSAMYNAYQTELNSGWIQTIFKRLPEWTHLPFITVYGVMQPVLPAAIADPAVWPSRLLGIWRGLGWYALLPLLVYSIYPILKTRPKRARSAWVWTWIVVWGWILVCSFRAGGDQWDNPRYRLMMLLFQAALAAHALVWALGSRDRWLGRVLAVEGVFLLCFGYWYITRYTEWEAGQVHVFIIFGLIVVLSLLILVGGWLMDRHRHKA